MPKPGESLGPIHPYFLRRFVAYWVIFVLHCGAFIALMIRLHGQPERLDPLVWGLGMFLIVNLVPLIHLHFPMQMYLELKMMR